MTDRPHRSRGSQHDKWLRDAPSALARAFAPVAGYGVTISSMFRPVVTEQYPFEPPQVMPRYHGRHQLNRYDDGLEKCIGCELCAWACPADAIYVEAASNEPGAQYSPGERYGRVYQINYLRCIFCGMCIEACPTRALTMSTDFDELVGPGREGLIYEKEDLLAPVPEAPCRRPTPWSRAPRTATTTAGRSSAPPRPRSIGCGATGPRTPAWSPPAPRPPHRLRPGQPPHREGSPAMSTLLMTGVPAVAPTALTQDGHLGLGEAIVFGVVALVTVACGIRRPDRQASRETPPST